MLRFEYPYSYDYRIPITPQLGVGVFFPSFHAPTNESIINDNQSSDSEQSTFDDFNNNNNDNFSNNNNDNNNNNNMIMNNNDNDNNNNNNDNNNESIHQESSLLSDSLPPTDSIPPPSVEFYVATPLFSPKTINAANDYLPPPSTISNNNHRNSISAVTSDDLSAFVMAGDGETNDSSSTSNNDNELVVNELPAVDLLPPPITGFAPLPVISPETIGSETDDEELFKKKKQKVSNNGAATTTKKTTGGRRGRKSAAAAATTAVDTSAAVPPPIPAPVPLSSDNPRKTSTGSDEDINDYSDSPNSSNPLSSSSDHYRTKHSISETRRRTRLRNQFKYLAEASTSAKTDRYSVLCAAIVKIEAAKRRIAELESQLAAATVGPTMGLSPLPPSSSGPSAMCCAESIEYGVCSQCSGVATALLSGDGVGTFLSANHRWLSLVGVHSLPELQSVAPSFLKVVGLSSAEISNARSTLSAVSAHKHGSMTLPLDSNTILAYKNHSDSSIEPALLYANIRYFPTKSSRPALLTLSSYEHGAADNRNPCVLVTAVPCEPLPEGVSISSYNDRLAHRGRKTIGNHQSNPSSSDSSSSSSSSSNAMIISNTGGTNKKEGKKRSYSQRVSSSRSNDRGEMAEDNNSNGFNARISNHFLKEEAF